MKDFIFSLYEKYHEDLKKSIKYQKNIIDNSFTPQFDHLESEITYMMIRHYKPKKVFEMSPYSGCSTSWILKALNDNGIKSELYSFDIEDNCTKNINDIKGIVDWIFILGDVRETFYNYENDYDYYHIDSNHDAVFAKWYFEDILNKRKLSNVPVGIHDIYFKRITQNGIDNVLNDKFVKQNINFDPSKDIIQMDHNGEFAVVVDYLNRNNIDYISASSYYDNIFRYDLFKIRQRYNIVNNNISIDNESMVFFNLKNK